MEALSYWQFNMEPYHRHLILSPVMIGLANENGLHERFDQDLQLAVTWQQPLINVKFLAKEILDKRGWPGS